MALATCSANLHSPRRLEIESFSRGNRETFERHFSANRISLLRQASRFHRRPLRTRRTSEMSHGLRRRDSCWPRFKIRFPDFDFQFGSTRHDGGGRWLWRLVRPIFIRGRRNRNRKFSRRNFEPFQRHFCLSGVSLLRQASRLPPRSL